MVNQNQAMGNPNMVLMNILSGKPNMVHMATGMAKVIPKPRAIQKLRDIPNLRAMLNQAHTDGFLI